MSENTNDRDEIEDLLVRHYAAPEADREYRETLLAEMERRIGSTIGRKPRVYRPVVALVACSAVLLALAVGVWIGYLNRASDGRALVSVADERRSPDDGPQGAGNEHADQQPGVMASPLAAAGAEEGPDESSRAVLASAEEGPDESSGAALDGTLNVIRRRILDPAPGDGSTVGTSTSQAATKEHYDLTSLVLLSDFVILAERGPTRPLKNWAKATSYTVKRVYRGSIVPGRKIELFDRGNSLELDAETILFIEKWEPSKSEMGWLPSDTPTLRVVPSGMRALSKGKVYRLVEDRRRGPHVLVPQYRDPHDVYSEFFGRGGPPVGVPEFEQDLQKAIRCVEHFHEAMAQEDREKRRESLLALLDPLDVQPEFPREPFLRTEHADALRQRLITIFLGDNDIDAMLEVAARSRHGLGHRFRLGDMVSDTQLLAAALSKDTPPHRRAAALYLLGCGEPEKNRGILTELPALLEDPDDEIRRAVATLAGQIERKEWHHAKETLALKEALMERWEQETVPAVRLAILESAMGRWIQVDPEERSPSTQPVFAAKVKGLTAHYAFESRWARAEELVVVAVPTGGGEPRRSLPLRSFNTIVFPDGDPENLPERERLAAVTRRSCYYWNSGNTIGGYGPIRFFPALPPDTYTVWLEGRFEKYHGREKTVTVKVSAGEVKIE